MALPVIAGVIRVAGAGLSRVAIRSATVAIRTMARTTAAIGARLAGTASTMGRTTQRMFKVKTRVDAKKAIHKLNKIDYIVQEVMQDAEAVMRKNTSKRSGYARNHTDYKGSYARNRDSKSIIAGIGKYQVVGDYNYAEYIDKPGVQLASSKGNPKGITGPTNEWIRKEIKNRIKKELR